MAQLLAEYDFLPATKEDYDDFVYLGITEFIKVEPHAVALGMTAPDARTLLEWLMGKCLHYPYSLKVVEKSTGQIVALNAVSLAHRDSKLDWEPFYLEAGLLPDCVQKLCGLFGKCSGEFWSLIDPRINKIVHQEVVFVLPAHQKKGIAKKMMTESFDEVRLRAHGIEGIASDTMSFANQTVLQKSGYQCVYEPEEHEWFSRIQDEAKGVKVMFKDIRQ